MSISHHSSLDMPINRHILKYVTLQYEKENELVCVSDPVSPEEKEMLEYSSPPPRGSSVLLHSCCSPCSGAMIQDMISNYGLIVTVFFYNPNIHPRREYEIRKDENIRYAKQLGVAFVDCDYDADSWYKRMVGFELEPERGVRCSACFDMRMEVSAAYAIKNGFQYFTTTNATSRWKDDLQVNLSGIRAANLYNNEYFPQFRMTECDPAAVIPQLADNRIHFWVHNWKTDVMTRRKYEISADSKFYKQEYCGCSYSLRDSNIWRAQQGLGAVRIGGDIAGVGTRYFEDADVDEAEESPEVVNTFFKDAQSHFGDTVRIQRQQTSIAKISNNVTNNVNIGEADDSHRNVYEGRKKYVESASDSLNNW